MARRTLPKKAKERIRTLAGDRCGYCRFPQDFSVAQLQFDHVISLDKGGEDTEENQCLLCPKCNRAKWGKIDGFDKETGQNVRLFDPRTDDWHEHFEWSSDALRITGKTAIGRVTVTEAKLNNPLFIRVRGNFIKAGLRPWMDADITSA